MKKFTKLLFLMMLLAVASNLAYGQVCPAGFNAATPAPSAPIITNSSCNIVTNVTNPGSISAPAPTGCPAGTVYQFSNDGTTWSSTAPAYDNDGPAQVIQVRCFCDNGTPGSTADDVASLTTAGVTAPSACPTCAPVTVVANSVESICTGGTSTYAAWQAAASAANPTVAPTSSILFTSGTPAGGAPTPAAATPSTTNNGCDPVTTTINAYRYCDVDLSGTNNAGDTYSLISVYSITVYPSAAAYTATLVLPTFDNCATPLNEYTPPSVTGGACVSFINPLTIVDPVNGCSTDAIASNDPVNGTWSVTQSSLPAWVGAAPACFVAPGTLNIAGAIIPACDGVNCLDCPAILVPDANGDGCDGLGTSAFYTGFSTWQAAVNAAVAAGTPIVPGLAVTTVYSTILPNEDPLDAIPDQLPTLVGFDGINTSTCTPTNQTVSAYTRCAITIGGVTTVFYSLVSTFTLTVYPTIATPVVALVPTAGCDGYSLTFDCAYLVDADGVPGLDAQVTPTAGAGGTNYLNAGNIYPNGDPIPTVSSGPSNIPSPNDADLANLSYNPLTNTFTYIPVPGERPGAITITVTQPGLAGSSIPCESFSYTLYTPGCCPLIPFIPQGVDQICEGSNSTPYNNWTTNVNAVIGPGTPASFAEVVFSSLPVGNNLNCLNDTVSVHDDIIADNQLDFGGGCKYAVAKHVYAYMLCRRGTATTADDTYEYISEFTLTVYPNLDLTDYNMPGTQVDATTFELTTCDDRLVTFDTCFTQELAIDPATGNCVLVDVAHPLDIAYSLTDPAVTGAATVWETNTTIVNTWTHTFWVRVQIAGSPCADDIYEIRLCPGECNQEITSYATCYTIPPYDNDGNPATPPVNGILGFGPFNTWISDVATSNVLTNNPGDQWVFSLDPSLDPSIAIPANEYINPNHDSDPTTQCDNQVETQYLYAACNSDWDPTTPFEYVLVGSFTLDKAPTVLPTVSQVHPCQMTVTASCPNAVIEYLVNYAELFTDNDLDAVIEPTDGNGVYDLGEPFTDANGNGIYDPETWATGSTVPGLMNDGDTYIFHAYFNDSNGNMIDNDGDGLADCAGPDQVVTIDFPEILTDHTAYICNDFFEDDLTQYEPTIITGAASAGGVGTWAGIADPTTVDPHDQPFQFVYTDPNQCRDEATLVYIFGAVPDANIENEIFVCPGEDGLATIQGTPNAVVVLSDGSTTYTYTLPNTLETASLNVYLPVGEYNGYVYLTNYLPDPLNCYNEVTGTISVIAQDCAEYANIGAVNSYVWFDEDNNGVYNTGEVGLGGVTVVLYSNAGPDCVVGTADDTNPVAITNTNPDGSYNFMNMCINDPISGNPIVYFIQTPTSVIIGGEVAQITLPNAAGPVVGDIGDSDINPSGLTSTFTLASGSVNNINMGYWYEQVVVGPVSLSLVNFNANASCDNVLLNWINADNSSAISYNVERSSNGTNWITVGTVTSNASGVYTYTDNFRASSTTYYRLVSVASNGTENISNIINAISNCENSVQITNIYPNPVTNTLNYDIIANEAGVYNIQVVDIMGRVYKTITLNVAAGTNRQVINTEDLAQAVYFIGIENQDVKTYAKFSKID